MRQMISSDSTQGKKLPRCHPFLLSEEKKDSLELILYLLSQADLFCKLYWGKEGAPSRPQHRATKVAALERKAVPPTQNCAWRRVDTQLLWVNQITTPYCSFSGVGGKRQRELIFITRRDVFTLGE